MPTRLYTTSCGPLFLILLATCGAAVRSWAEERQPVAANLDRAIAEAETALQENEPQVAESRYRSALLEGWLLLGSLEVEEGRLQAAKEAFERATTCATETRRPRISLALIQLQMGEARGAAALLRGVLGQDSTDLEARRLLSRALMAAGQVDEAVQELEELRALAPENLENSFLLATAYLRQERPERAEPLFAALVEKRPIPQTHILISRVYRDFGQYEAARQALETALEMDPEVRRAHYYLGTVDLLQQGRGRLDEAIAHFEAELRVAPEDAMTNLYLGIALVEERRHEEALPHLEVASRLGASERDALQFLGRSYLALGRPSEAVTALRQALELAAAERLETPDGVLMDLQESQLSSLHYQLALALRRTGDETTAATHFEAAKRHSAQLAESTRELLAQYLKNETRQNPAATFPSALELSSLAELNAAERLELKRGVTRGLAQVYLNLGVLKTRAERFSRAAELFAQAAQLDPDFPQVQYSLGVALFNSEQFERATAPLSRALAESPTDDNLRRMLGLAWLNVENYEMAAELLRDDRERDVNRSLQYAYGLALVRSGRAAEAEPIFVELLTENADWPELNVVLGQAYAAQDDYDAAVRQLERAIALKPDVGEAHATLGDIYLRQGRLAEAEEALRTELRSHPQDLRARYTLAVVLELNRKPEEAQKLLRSLLREKPRMADGRYLLGKILLAEGAAEEALEQLAAAARLAPKDANIHYQLGQAYQRLGKSEEASQAFETFRRLKQSQRSGEQP